MIWDCKCWISDSSHHKTIPDRGQREVSSMPLTQFPAFNQYTGHCPMCHCCKSDEKHTVNTAHEGEYKLVRSPAKPLPLCRWRGVIDSERTQSTLSPPPHTHSHICKRTLTHTTGFNPLQRESEDLPGSSPTALHFIPVTTTDYQHRLWMWEGGLIGDSIKQTL